MRLRALICSQFTTSVGLEETLNDMHRGQHPSAQLSTCIEKGFSADSPLLGPGGTVTVLLGSTSIGTAALSGVGRRLLALTSTFSVTITVPTGTAAGNQVPCVQGLSHPML